MPILHGSLVPSSITRAFIDGRARPKGIEIELADNSQATAAVIIEQNSKHMVALDLDLAEMSLGTYTRARDLGLPIVALPIFPGRRFLQPAILVAPHVKIDGPEGLRGKSAAFNQFWQTATIWHRVVLHQTYGITQDEMTHVALAPERWDALPTPPVKIRRETSGRDALTLMKAGEIDIGLIAGANILPEDAGGVRRLFPDPVPVQQEYFRTTGMLPIIHLVVIREELAQDGALVAALCAAFEESKQLGLESMIETPRERPLFGGTAEQVRDLFGPDPWPYGVEPNRHVLDQFLEDVSTHQGLTDRRLTVDELFPAGLPPQFA
jgi:4,5-dihydroxyphthalate decarboxylase